MRSVEFPYIDKEIFEDKEDKKVKTVYVDPGKRDLFYNDR